MDLNALMNTMLSGESLQSISQMSGSSQDEVKSVLSAALPSLLGGALEQSQNEATADGFAQALSDHAKADTRDLGQFVSNVDMIDGGKILTHLLGGNATATAEEVATRSGLGVGQTIKILALVAPLLMSLLGQQTQQSQPQNALSGNLVGSLMSGMLGGGGSSGGAGLLGSLLGGGSSNSSSSAGAGLLGTLLGGGSSNSSGAGTGLLGSLLGGGLNTAQTTAPASTSTTTGKKKKKKAAASGETIPLTQEAAQQTQQQSQGSGLMDILMGLLK